MATKPDSVTFKATIVGGSSALIASTIVANLIAMAGYALMATVFPIERVGEFFAIIAMSNILSVFVHFGLLQAIPLMSDHELKIGVTILVCMSVILIASAAVFAGANYRVAYVLLAAGILSLSALIEAIMIRSGLIRGIAVFRMSIPLVSFSAMLVIGLRFGSDVGVILGGYLAGMLAVVLGFFRLSAYPLLIKAGFDDIRSLLKTYSKFPRFIGPGMLLHTAAYNLPSVVGLHYFGGAAIAAFNLAYKFVLSPMTIIGKAVAQAYTSHLSAAYRKGGSLAVDYRLDLILFGLAMIVSIGIYTILPFVFAVFFPEDHESVSRYAIALIPLVIAMLTVSPLAILLQFTDNQKRIFQMHLASFIGSVLSLIVAVQVDSFLVGIAVFSVFILVRYGFLYVQILIARKH